MVGACITVLVILSSLPFMRMCVLALAHDCGTLPTLLGEVDRLAVGLGRVTHLTHVFRGDSVCAVSSKSSKVHCVVASCPFSSLKEQHVLDGCCSFSLGPGMCRHME